MSGFNVRNQSLNRKTKSLQEQLDSLRTENDDLKTHVSRLTDMVNQLTKACMERFQSSEEVVNALVIHSGPETIQQIMKEEAQRVQQEKEAVQKAMMEEAVKDGYAVPSDVVTETSAVVGVQYCQDGTPEINRAQMLYKELKPEFKTALLGKGVGYRMELPDNKSFEITEIYTIDEEKGNRILAEKQVAKAAMPDVQKDFSSFEEELVTNG